MLLSRHIRAPTFPAARSARRTIMSATSTQPAVRFGPFEVTEQVFLKTPHSFGLVNLKPLVPGHTLVCPLKPHRRLTDLSAPEVTDLFTAVQLVQRMLARTYFPGSSASSSSAPPPPTASASSDEELLLRGSFNIAVQDGAEAGQTVPHVHVHVIPRAKGDMPNADDVYVRMAEEKGNVGGSLWDRSRPVPGGAMPRIEDADRAARTKEQMGEETERYRAALRGMGVDWKSGQTGPV